MLPLAKNFLSGVEVDSSHPSTQRRRSERVAESLPIVVRGVDLLGQPFEERTATLAFNLHGCRYASKHHLPKNTWVTIELARGAQLHNVRARVAWIQRPHSVREFFQIAVELENPENIWAFEPVPPGWVGAAAKARAHQEALRKQDGTDMQDARPREIETVSQDTGISRDEPMAEMNESIRAAANPVTEEAASESPLIRDIGADLERRANHAVEEAAARAEERIRQTAAEIERRQASSSEEFLRKWHEDFEQAQRSALEALSAQAASEQGDALRGVKSEIEESFGQTRRMIEEAEKKAAELRRQSEAASEAASRIAQARLGLEAMETARGTHASTERPKEESPIFEAAATGWRERLASETSIAQAQWNELLQSSLDGGVQRIVDLLSARSQEIVRSTEAKFTERFNELRQPLAQLTLEARQASAEVRSALDQELARAKASLGEIEHSASRMNEFSTQIEATAQDSVHELRRRLEGILDTQTEEMNRRAETIINGATQKAAPALESLGQRQVEQTLAEVEMRLAPHLDRVPQLISELSNREVQVEDALRLHRERLRQVSENSQRELSSHLAATVAEVRNDFETARREAIARWNEELDASGVRAAHAASESIERSSQWFQQETQTRLQVLVEQTLAGANASLEEKANEAKQKFATGLEAETAPHLARIRGQLDTLTGELVGSARTQIEQAAEATAAAFGQVLRGISDQEVEHFSNASQSVLLERNSDLEAATGRFLGRFETDAEASLGRLRERLGAEVDSNVTAGRSALAAELNNAVGGYRAECDAQHKEWIESLDRLGEEAAGRYRERLDTTCDSWMVSSVRRLNEHGQNVIESLMRSADQALRDSCARFFEGLAETLRDRGGSNGTGSYAPGAAAREGVELPQEHSDTALNQPNL